MRQKIRRLPQLVLIECNDFLHPTVTHVPVHEAGRVIVDPELLRLYPSSDGMMHYECMVGVGGTAFHWERAVREVPDTAQLHETVFERLGLPAVRNFTSYGPYRPAALRNHKKAKKFYDVVGSDVPA